MSVKVVETHNIGTDYEYYGKGSVSVTAENSEGERMSATIYAGEPEDNSFYRDLSGAMSIADLAKFAYEAGKRGEPFEYEFMEDDE